MIVKIQKSINPTGRVLIYDQRQAFVYQGRLTKHLKQTLGNRLKVYVEAEIEDGKPVLYHTVPNQDW